MLILLGSACSSGTKTSSRSSASVTVDRVVDGDTLVLIIDGKKEKVRLIGIDTPETVKPNTPVQCYGLEASLALKAMLPAGTKVRIERDEEARDRYQRLLLYVYRQADDVFVNLQLVQQGFARIMSIAPNTAHAPYFAAAANAANAAAIGLWGACPR